MSEVRDWLNSIGLAQYADAFEAGDIDMELVGQAVIDGRLGRSAAPGLRISPRQL